jgi:histidyl-tRNA synthetase
MAVRRHIERAWRDASVAFGFEEIDGPTFEYLELYTAKSGPGIVKELFSFKREGGDSTYALRPEFTPTLARMAAARISTLPLPVKWFTMPSFFRAERPQRGRLREFQQWNVDVLGVGGPAIDAEVIGVAVAALERLGLTPRDVRVKISHREAARAWVLSMGVSEQNVPAAFDLLDRKPKMEKAAYERAASEIGLLFRDAAEIKGESLDALRCALDAAGLAEWYDVDATIVRGLAYYTGTVFEIHEASGAERAVAGGGRYDGLVELFGGPSTPAMGLGMGDVVLGLLLADRGLLPKDGADLLPRPDVFIISGGDDAAERELPRMVASLRKQGLHVRHSYKATRNVGKLLSDASKQRARCAVILGPELASGSVKLKDMGSGEQRDVQVANLAETIGALRSRA